MAGERAPGDLPLILLAAGKSSRMGEPKGLLDFRGRPWLEEQLRRFAVWGGREAVVVLGHERERYEAALPWLREARTAAGVARDGTRVRVAVNEDPSRGPFSSLQAGIGALGERVDGAFVCPIDVPLAGPAAGRALAGALDEAALACIPEFEGRGGHPVVLAGELLARLANVPPEAPEARLDEQLRRLPAERVRRVPVGDAQARMNLNSPEDWRRLAGTPATDLAGRDAAVLAAAEVGLGSILHAFHVPLSGQALSLNQSFLLTRSLRDAASAGTASRALPLTVSTIAAVLKALSPAGKKLTPMLAISAQGALYGAGTLALGCNLAGACAGSALASVWAFAQPVLILYVLLGRTLATATAALAKALGEAFSFAPERFVQVALAMVALKAAVAAGLAIAAWRLPESRMSRWHARLIAAARERGIRAGLESSASPSERADLAAHARGALRDLLNPLFFVSLALTAVFFALAESGLSSGVWLLLRPVAAGFLLFFLLRLIPIESWPARLETSSRLRPFAGSLREAIRILREIRE